MAPSSMLRFDPRWAAALLLAAVGCGGEASESTLAQTESALEGAVAALVDKSKSIAILNLAAPPGAKLRAALVAATDRGVLVRAIVREGDYAETLEALHVLETAGVDLDVRADDVGPGSVGVVDAVALTTSGSPPKLKKSKSKSKVKALRAKLEALLEPVLAPSVGLAPPGTVRVHAMPEASHRPLLDALDAATTSIDVSVYQLGDRKIMGALAAASARGVAVRVMLEPKTVKGVNYPEVAAELEAAGVDVQPTPPYFDDSFRVDHAKLVLVDDARLLLGTGNLVRSGLGGVTVDRYDNRDHWVEDTRAESVAEARALFEGDWTRTPTSAAMFSELVVTPDGAEGRLGALVDQASERLFVAQQFFTDKAMLGRVLAAEARGVDVRVLLGWQPTTGEPPPNEGTRAKLGAAGVDAAYFTRHYLHGKLLLADGRAFVGSQNFTKGGLVRNREAGVVLDDPTLVAALAAGFTADAAAPGDAP